METKAFTLAGKHILLEPLDQRHVDGLVAAAAADRSLYHWSPVPQGTEQATAYINTALAWRDAGTALPFAVINPMEGAVIGSTRFWNLERWSWPPAHSRYGREFPDACEIGYTWFTRSAIRTAANTETKLLMLTQAFETWDVLRVCFHTDARNQRSRAASNASAESSKAFSAPTAWRQTLFLATQFAIPSLRRSGPGESAIESTRAAVALTVQDGHSGPLGSISFTPGCTGC